MVKGNFSSNTVSPSVDDSSNEMFDSRIIHNQQKYPCCIVWTPIPFLTWFFPVVGHMGIATSSGVIRDFAGSFHVGSGNMAFGKPTKFWQLDPMKAVGGLEGWDKAIAEASETYKGRHHNLFVDNCHSHVAMALNKMVYNGKSNWNMVKLAFLILFVGKFVNCVGILKTWIPFCIILTAILLFVFLS